MKESLNRKDFNIIKRVLKEYSNIILDRMVALPDDSEELDILHAEFKDITNILKKLY